MRIGKIEIKHRVWIGLAAALVVTGVWWTTARINPAVATASVPVKAPFVRLAGAGPGASDRVLREQAELMDPTPLFFPTERNFGQRPLGENMRRQPGQIFGSFPANVEFGEKGIKAYGAETAVAPERLADVIVQSSEAPFAGMGRIDAPLPALTERTNYMEARKLGTEESVISQIFKGFSPPRPDFAPIEFLAVVSSAGLVGEPILVSGSGWEEVDSFVSSYLVKSFKLGERLSPGRYRVLVGP